MEAVQDLQCLRPPFPSSAIADNFFCPSCLPQAPWIQRGSKKLTVRSKQSLRLRTRLDLTYS